MICFQSTFLETIATRYPNVIAPRKAWRIFQGESPCREEISNDFLQGLATHRIEPWTHGGDTFDHCKCWTPMFWLETSCDPKISVPFADGLTPLNNQWRKGIEQDGLSVGREFCRP